MVSKLLLFSFLLIVGCTTQPASECKDCNQQNVEGVWELDWKERDECGPWWDELKFCYVTFHLLSFLAYALGIPIILMYSAIKRKREGKSSFKLLFHHYTWIPFFIFCGIGHLLDAYSMVYTNYIIHTINVGLTAAASWFAIFFLPNILFKEGHIIKKPD